MKKNYDDLEVETDENEDDQDLHEPDAESSGVDLQLENIRREQPDWSDQEEIENLRERLQKLPPQWAALHRLVNDPKGSKNSPQDQPREKSTIGMFRELWRVVPHEYRMTLIGELMFNPMAIQKKYHEELKFRSNLERRWKK